MVSLRSAEHRDANNIAALHVTSWRQTYRGMMSDEFLDDRAAANRLETWHVRLSSPRDDQFVCLAEEGGELIGFICVYGAEDATWGSYVDNLHVKKDRKRSGVGATLMFTAGRWLEERYPKWGVYLWVMEANNAARRFYEKLGARNAGVVDKLDPGGGSAPNCRYVWPSPAILGNEHWRSRSPGA